MDQALTRYIPDHWGPTLASLCEGTAGTLQAIARCSPSESKEMRALAHEIFDTDIYFVPALTEEINQALANHTASLVRGLGHLINRVGLRAARTPLVIAALETSSLLQRINQFSYVDRCYWATRVITDKMTSPRLLREFSELEGFLEAIQTAYETKVSDSREPFPDDATLVSEMMGHLIGGDSFYKEECEYAEQHALAAHHDATVKNQYPATTEFHQFLGTIHALRCAESAAHFLAWRRDGTESEGFLEALSEISSRRERIASEYNEQLKIALGD